MLFTIKIYKKALAKSEGFEAVAHFGSNVYSTYSANYYKEQGVKAVVLSTEILLKDAQKISADIEKGIISYGRIPLMLTRNCPVKNKKSCSECGRAETLIDRKGERFPVMCRNGYSELYNSKVVWLADRQNELRGLDFQILYFTTETPEEVDSVLNAYKNGMPKASDFTRGMYYRGVE